MIGSVGSKKGVKRHREDEEDSDSQMDMEDEFDNRQVTSTSVEKNAKMRKRKSSKVLEQYLNVQIEKFLFLKKEIPCLLNFNAFKYCVQKKKTFSLPFSFL